VLSTWAGVWVESCVVSRLDLAGVPIPPPEPCEVSVLPDWVPDLLLQALKAIMMPRMMNAFFIRWVFRV
jgi:hypothetical protein